MFCLKAIYIRNNCNYYYFDYQENYNTQNFIYILNTYLYKNKEILKQVIIFNLNEVNEQ